MARSFSIQGQVDAKGGCPMKWFRVCTAGILVVGMAGCGFIERKGVDTATPLLSRTVDNMMRLKSARLAESGLPSQILLISALVEFTPNNPRLLTIASQAYAPTD